MYSKYICCEIMYILGASDIMAFYTMLKQGKHDDMQCDMIFVGQEVTDQWYSEVKKYDFNRNDFTAGNYVFFETFLLYIFIVSF